jgi:hypothetical protein
MMLGDALGEAINIGKPKSLHFDVARLGGATITAAHGKGRI